MANGTTESQDLLERWKAEHPELSGGGSAQPRSKAKPPPPRPRLAAVPDPQATNKSEQRDMIERWRREHPELTGLAVPRPVAQQETQRLAREQERRIDEDRRFIDLESTPMTVLGAFIIGCIIGGIVMVVITGIAFWGFAGG